MVDLSKRVQKPYTKVLDFGEGPEEFLFPFMNVAEQARVSSLADDKKAEEIIYRMAKVVDPSISRDDAVNLDLKTVRVLMDVFSEMYSDDDS